MMIADAVVASAETPVAETTNRSRRLTGSLMAATYGQPGCRDDSARRQDSEESRSTLPQRAADDAGQDDGGRGTRHADGLPAPSHAANPLRANGIGMRAGASPLACVGGSSWRGARPAVARRDPGHVRFDPFVTLLRL